MIGHAVHSGGRPRTRTARAILIAGLLPLAAVAGVRDASAQPVVVESGWTLIRTIAAPNAVAAHFNPRDGRIYYGRRGSAADGLYRIDDAGFSEQLATGSNVAAVAVQPDSGHVFFSEDYGGIVYRTAFAGTGRTAWVSGFRSGDDDPIGMAFAPAGHGGGVLQAGEALVVDRGNSGYDDVWWWSPLTAEGEYLVHPDDGTLIDPVDVAIGLTDVYIVDGRDTAAGAIYVLRPDSSLTALATSEALADPSGIAIDPLDGDLLVLDQGAGRLVRVDPATGGVSAVVTGLSTVNVKWAGVDVSPDGRRLLLTDLGAGQIHVLARCDATGQPELDCNGNGLYDLCEVVLESAPDCDHNGVPDACDLAAAGADCNDDGVLDACPVCPPVQLVFIMDTSTSMDDEAAALCSGLGLIVDYLENAGVEVQPLLLGICDLPGGAYSCLEATVADSLGTSVPGAPPAGLETLGACPGGVEVCQEDWGLATAVVAGLYPWAPADASIRLIIPLTDEGAWCGDPISTYDEQSVTHAIAVAVANGVIVSPITGSGSASGVIAQAQALADATGGTRFSSTSSANDIAYAIAQQTLAACARYTDCDASGVLDECEIARHPSLDFNADGVLDRCQEGATAVPPGPASAAGLWLDRSHPNPFNPRTVLSFFLRAPRQVTLAIHALDGRRVRTLLDERHPAGLHSVEWDGRDDRQRMLPSGVYFCRLTAGRDVATTRMTLLK